MGSIVSETDSTASFLYSLIMDYFSSFILLACPCVCVCVFMFSPFFCVFSAGSSATRGRSESRGTFFWAFFSPPLPLSHSSLFLPDLPLKRPCFCFIKSGFFLCVHCVFFLSLYLSPTTAPLRTHRERDQSQVTERLPHGRQM